MAADEYIWPVSYTTDLQEKARVNSIQFGEGYSQEASDGLNPLMITVNVVHDNITDATLLAILTLLRAKKGAAYFTWTPTIPGYTDHQRKFKCDSWVPRPLQYNSNSLTASFREVFEP